MEPLLPSDAPQGNTTMQEQLIIIVKVTYYTDILKYLNRFFLKIPVITYKMYNDDTQSLKLWLIILPQKIF